MHNSLVARPFNIQFFNVSVYNSEILEEVLGWGLIITGIHTLTIIALAFIMLGDEQEGQILLRDQIDAAQPEYEDVPAHIIFNIYDRLEELTEALRLLSNVGYITIIFNY